jgi:hypothetical protein
MALSAAGDPRVATAVIMNSGVIRMTSLPPGLKFPPGIDPAAMLAKMPAGLDALKTFIHECSVGLVAPKLSLLHE